MAEEIGAGVFFAYRYFDTYQRGVNRDLSEKVKAVPLLLLSNSTFFHRLNQSVTNRLLNLSIKLPFWVLQRLGAYALYDYLILRKTIRQIKPDLIHVNNGGYPASFICQTAILAAKHAGVDKIIFHINNPAQTQDGLLDKLIDKKIYEYTDCFITASRQALLSLEHKRFFNANKLVQIYNTVENPIIIKSREEICKAYNIDADKFILCEVAFLSRRKGQLYILKALSKIKEKYPDIFTQLVLFLVGDGEDSHRLKRYCEINELQNVVFTGYQANYVDFIASSDVFILPSVGYEDMPLVILSAMKLRKPIIASEVAGISEEIENLRSGVLLKVEELDNIYIEIVRLYKDGDLRNYYAENALKRFNEYFTQSRIYSDIKRLYSKLLND